MATADSLIDIVRRRLQDATDEAYSDALLFDAINEGSKIFAAATGCCQDVAEVTPDGSNSYIDLDTSNLTYRMVNVYAAEHGNTKLDFAPRYEAAKWAPSGTATTAAAWSVWADGATERMYFDEVPEAGSDIKVWFTYVPADVTSTSDTVGLPEKWHPALIAYMRYCVHNSNRDDGRAQMAYQEFTGILQVAAKINEGLMSRGGYS